MTPGADRRIRVMLADDFPEMHLAIARLLTPDCEIVGTLTDDTLILEEASRLQPDVVVLDIRLSGSNGLDTCRRLKVAVPALPVVLYSANDDTAIKRCALEAGAVGFVSKNHIADDLLPAIRRAAQSMVS